MKVILIDDWIYADIDGAVGIYGREEFLRSIHLRASVCQAAFLNYEIGIIRVSGAEDPYKKGMIAKVFKGEYLTSYERLSDRAVQVFASSKEVIDSIYRYLTGIKLEKLVPYGVALRAFLRSRELLSSDEAVIFIDDLHKQGLITVFEGDRMSVTRRISLNDASQLVSEVKRSWQAFIVQRAESTRSPGRFRLVSNNDQWLKMFMENDFLRPEDTVCIKEDFAVLEGLKSAEFSVHFFSPERLLAQKKKTAFKQRLRMLVISVLLICLGAGLCVAGYLYRIEQERRCDEGQKKMALLKESLSNAHRDRFKEVLKRQGGIDYAEHYHRLSSSLSLGWDIKMISFERLNDRVWRLQADVHSTGVMMSRDPILDRRVFFYDIQESILGNAQERRLLIKIEGKGV